MFGYKDKNDESELNIVEQRKRIMLYNLWREINAGVIEKAKNMVKTVFAGNCTQIILKPNRSATWQQAKWLVIAIATVVLTIAIAWAILGAWLILPFAGVEVGLLAILMYYVNRHCHEKQVITIDNGHIVFECGIKHPVFRWQFDKQDTYISVCEAEHPYDQPVLVLTDEHISIHLGEFLNREDCEKARKAFSLCGLIEVSNQWWR